MVLPKWLKVQVVQEQKKRLLALLPILYVCENQMRQNLQFFFQVEDT